MSNFRGLLSRFRDKEEFYFYDKFSPVNPGFPSATPSPTPTITPTTSITPTPSITPTSSITPTPTSSVSPTPSITPTITATLTPTPSITASITPTPSFTPTPTPSPSPPPFEDFYTYIIDTSITSGGSATDREISGSTTNTLQYRVPKVRWTGSPGYTILWGDGTQNTYTDYTRYVKTYAASGQYTIKITPSTSSGKIISIEHWGVTNTQSDAIKVTEVTYWGNNKVDYGEFNINHFERCHSLTTLPSTTQPSFISTEGSMSGWFKMASAFNQDIGGWDTSNVVDMSSAFEGYYNGVRWLDAAFNQDIGNWDVSNVTDMSSMFRYNRNFNNGSNTNPIDDWVTSGVTTTQYMFERTEDFNRAIGKWNMSNNLNLRDMFAHSVSFNQNIGGWDVSSGDVNGMFEDAQAFNNGGSSSINNWDITAFNQAMSDIFRDAIAFNQPVGDWDVSQQSLFRNTFRDATSFNQSLANWVLDDNYISPLSPFTSMLDNCGMSQANYDATLIGWAALPNPPQNITIGVNGLTYTNSGSALAARNTLITTYGWTFVGDTGI